MLEHGDFRLRRTNEPLTIANQMARGLYEGVMTLLGLIVVITPLAIWTVPFGGPFACLHNFGIFEGPAVS